MVEIWGLWVFWGGYIEWIWMDVVFCDGLWGADRMCRSGMRIGLIVGWEVARGGRGGGGGFDMQCNADAVAGRW